MRKKLQDLTIKDAFMFAAVMSDTEQCRHLQKDCIVTQFRIEKLQKSIAVLLGKKITLRDRLIVQKIREENENENRKCKQFT